METIKAHLPCKTQGMVVWGAHLFPFVKPICLDNHVCQVDVIASGSNIQRCFSLLKSEGEKWAGKDLTMLTWQSLTAGSWSYWAMYLAVMKDPYSPPVNQVSSCKPWITFNLLHARLRESFAKIFSISSAAMGELSVWQQHLGMHLVSHSGL